jgi:uncharacterized membrane protein YfcA
MTLRIVESLVVGGLLGFLSGLLGVGGGFILVPLLTILGESIHTAIGTSVAFVACATLAGTMQHIRQGSLDVLVALTMTLPAAVLANIGARFAGLLSPSTLSILFACLLLGVLVMYAVAPDTRARLSATNAPTTRFPWYILQRQRVVADTPYHYHVNLLKAVVSGMIAGGLTGFFGVGGGFFLVPVAVVILHIPIRVTIGTCLAVSVLPAWVGTATHWRLGHVDVGLWIPLVIAGILSSQLGARCVMYFSPILIKRCFLGLLAMGALFMFAKGFMLV